MTAAEVHQLIDQLWTRNGNDRVDDKDLRDVAHQITNLASSQDVNDSIPDWTAGATFNTDGSGAGKYCKYPDTVGNKRIFETKINGNIAHVPPTNPEIHEDAYWKELSPSSGSAIEEWKPGVYGAGLIIVYHNHSEFKDILCKLNVGTRPFTSNNIEAEIAIGQWAIIGGTGGGGSGGGGILSGQWTKKADTTATATGNGNIKFNNAAINAITEIYISQVTKAGGDVASVLGVVHIGHELIIQQQDDAARIAIFKVAALPVDNGEWWTIAATVIDDNGLMYVNNKDVVVAFDLTEPIPDAGETEKGLIKLATQTFAEGAASSSNVATIDDTTAITPKKLRQFYAKVCEILTAVLNISTVAIDCLNRRESIHQYSAAVNHTIDLQNAATLSVIHIHALLSGAITVAFKLNGIAANFIAPTSELPGAALWNPTTDVLSITAGTNEHWEINITRVNFSGVDYYKIKASGPAT